ncbi:RING-type zinc-finger domain-containing protein [Ditylenchus destructor]|uniref:RING-type zinc-finger domain-containing protein n=1 Tax=Ditylenchus destructor TaxID=166010 RepID=A0AAD4N0M2_9BILA|nr:RING-type zinc-finger domain-containing protein [Ditylenchus destructor]
MPEDEAFGLVRSFSCAICLEGFTKNKRYPVALNCGHSFCAVCVKHMSRSKCSICCGLCKKHTCSSHKRLGKNFLFLELLEKNNLLEKDKEKKPRKPAKEKKPTCAGPPADVWNCNEDWSSNEADVSDDSSTTSDRYPQFFGPTFDFNFFSVRSDQIEEFYDTLESIQDLLYGFGTAPQNDEFDRQLEQLRGDMGNIEQNMRNTRSKFLDIAEKARRLYQTVRESGPSAMDRMTSGDSDLVSWLGNHFVQNGWNHDLFGADASNSGFRTRVIPWSLSSEEDDYDEPEETPEQFLSRNFMRVIERVGDHIQRVECYLCNRPFTYSSSTTNTHIWGRRHQSLIRANLTAPNDITEGAIPAFGSTEGSEQNGDGNSTNDPWDSLPGWNDEETATRQPAIPAHSSSARTRAFVNSNAGFGRRSPRRDVSPPGSFSFNGGNQFGRNRGNYGEGHSRRRFGGGRGRARNGGGDARHNNSRFEGEPSGRSGGEPSGRSGGEPSSRFVGETARRGDENWRRATNQDGGFANNGFANHGWPGIRRSNSQAEGGNREQRNRVSAGEALATRHGEHVARGARLRPRLTPAQTARLRQQFGRNRSNGNGQRNGSTSTNNHQIVNLLNDLLESDEQPEPVDDSSW